MQLHNTFKTSAFVILFHLTTHKSYVNATKWTQPPSNGVPNSINENSGVGPSRLVTALPLARKQWRTVRVLSEASTSKKELSTSHHPLKQHTLGSSPSTHVQKMIVENKMSSHPFSGRQDMNDREHPKFAEYVSESVEHGNTTLQGDINKTDELEKPTYPPTKPLETVSTPNKTLNRSTDTSEQHSRLLLSVQAVKAADVPTANISSIESVANRTDNGSAVLISNSRQIEVVIIAEEAPKLAPQETTTVFQLPSASHGPNRLFPSDTQYQNGTSTGARRPRLVAYKSRQYWAVYLTLALLCLSVLAICLMCCTSQGRRDMSFPAPKPVQYGQQLPPYSYHFSYDMRQAESQERARLNPENP